MWVRIPLLPQKDKVAERLKQRTATPFFMSSNLILVSRIFEIKKNIVIPKEEELKEPPNSKRDYFISFVMT